MQGSSKWNVLEIFIFISIEQHDIYQHWRPAQMTLRTQIYSLCCWLCGMKYAAYAIWLCGMKYAAYAIWLCGMKYAAYPMQGFYQQVSKGCYRMTLELFWMMFMKTVTCVTLSMLICFGDLDPWQGSWFECEFSRAPEF